MRYAPSDVLAGMTSSGSGSSSSSSSGGGLSAGSVAAIVLAILLVITVAVMGTYIYHLQQAVRPFTTLGKWACPPRKASQVGIPNLCKIQGCLRSFNRHTNELFSILLHSRIFFKLPEVDHG